MQLNLSISIASVVFLLAAPPTGLLELLQAAGLRLPIPLGLKHLPLIGIWLEIPTEKVWSTYKIALSYNSIDLSSIHAMRRLVTIVFFKAA